MTHGGDFAERHVDALHGFAVQLEAIRTVVELTEAEVERHPHHTAYQNLLWIQAVSSIKSILADPQIAENHLRRIEALRRALSQVKAQ